MAVEAVRRRDQGKRKGFHVLVAPASTAAVINRDVTAGIAWEFMDAGPGPYSVSRGPLAGTLRDHYSTNYLNFVALNSIWKF